MVTNEGNTEGLFRGAFMQSGSPIPVGDITHGQKYYDSIVSQTGCAGSSDTLNCLRTVPYSNLKNAMNKSPFIFSYQVGTYFLAVVCVIKLVLASRCC
jgi:acetylcholinesterase